MSKKLSLLLSLMIPVAAYSAEAKIVEYDAAAHKASIEKIVFQDPNKLFADSTFFNRIGYVLGGLGLTTGLIGSRISHDFSRKMFYVGASGYALASGFVFLDNKFDFSKRKKTELDKMLNDSHHTKSVLLGEQGKVIGLSATVKSKEESIESLKKKMLDAGHTMTDEQLRQAFPAFKLTDGECKDILTVEWLAVDRVHRGKGYGTLLINNSIESAKKAGIPYIDLNVVNTNKDAKRLYEKLGFVVTDPQPMGFGLIGATQLRKTLKEQA